MTALVVLLASVVVGQAPDEPPSADETSAVAGDQAPAPVPTGFSTRVQVGASTRSIFDIPIRGGDVGFSAGRQFRWVAVYGDLGLFVGKSAAGLQTVDVLVGASTELRLGTRGRLGFGLALTYLSISRATGGPRMDGLSLTPSAHVACDVVQFDEMDLYLALRGAFESFGSRSDQPQGEMQVVTLSVGLRLH